MLEHGQASRVEPPRVVVLGATGFVGATIEARLAADGMAVLGLGSRHLDLLAADAAEGLASLLQPTDALVFVSALTPDRGRDASTFVKNLTMGERVCVALAVRGVAHVVYLGSDAVYADGASLVDESTPCHPSSLHGCMHLGREVMLTTSVKTPLAILRPSLLYGEGDTHNGYGPNRFRRLAARGERIVLFGEGEERRDHVLVDDVAELVRLCILHRSRGVLNIATGHSASFREVAELAVANFPDPAAIAGSPRATPITHRHFDITQTIQAFPGFSYTPLAAGLQLVHGRAMEQDR